MRRRLGADPLGIDRILLAVHDVAVDPIFDVRAAVGRSEDTLRVGLILSEQQRDISLAVQVTFAEFGVTGDDDAHPLVGIHGFQSRLGPTFCPRPGVAEPERGQHMERSRLRPPVVHVDPNQDSLG